MSTKTNKLDETGKGNPFKVPAGYFEQFSSEMISRLPEHIVKEPEVVTIWTRVKPWIYMAAMFAGIALMIKMLAVAPDTKGEYQSGITITSNSDIEDFYSYYEDQLISDAYRQALFIEAPDDSSYFENLED